MWSVSSVFYDYGFHSVCPLMEKDKRLMEASWWERLTEGETGSSSDGWGHAKQIFNPISVDGWSCVSSLLFYWGQTMVEVMKIMATSFKWSHAVLLHLLLPTLQQATADPPSAGDSWTLPGKSGSVSFGVTAPFSCVLVHTRFCLCPPRVYFPVPCKFWRLYAGVNGDFQEGWCHSHVCCTQSPRPCSGPLLTHTSRGDAQTQFCFSLCGVPGSWCAQGLFEPSECLYSF